MQRITGVGKPPPFLDGLVPEDGPVDKDYMAAPYHRFPPLPHQALGAPSDLETSPPRRTIRRPKGMRNKGFAPPPVKDLKDSGDNYSVFHLPTIGEVTSRKAVHHRV